MQYFYVVLRRITQFFYLFWVYFAMVRVAQVIRRRTIGWSVDDELYGMWKEPVDA
jgi:hypothetical protein